MQIIFKVFIEFVTPLLLFFALVFLAERQWDLSFWTRDRTPTSCIGRQSLHSWTTSKVSTNIFLIQLYCSVDLHLYMVFFVAVNLENTSQL